MSLQRDPLIPRADWWIFSLAGDHRSSGQGLPSPRWKFRISGQENAPKKGYFLRQSFSSGNQMTNASLMMSAAADLCESSLADLLAKRVTPTSPQMQKTEKCFTVFCLSEQKDSCTRDSCEKGKPASCILASFAWAAPGIRCTILYCTFRQALLPFPWHSILQIA